MDKRLAATITLLTLICIASIPISCVKSQTSQGITINPDGTLTPPNAPIRREGNTFTLTADLNITITIQKADITLDGGDHKLNGPGSDQNFISITIRATNVTVENLHISNWRAGIYGAYNNGTITNNEFSNNYQAIAVYANDYLIKENNITSSKMTALLIDGGATRPIGDNNLITQNQITNNNCAFDILNSNGTTITKNNVTNNAVILTLGTQNANLTLAGTHTLYLNNFINNAQTLRVPFGGPFASAAPTISPAGQWDNGTIGNYWSDYQTRYPNATEVDNSGIGNKPYSFNDSTTWQRTLANGTYEQGTAIFGTATDRYPLMAPISTNSTSMAQPAQTSAPRASPTNTPMPQTSASTNTPHPSPSIQEIPTLSLLLTLVAFTIATTIFLKRKTNHPKSSN